MKKFISGFIAGALLFGGVSAFAASGLIGQKVQGLYSIEKGGTKVADAVIINGSAYAPVRAVAAATGAGLTVEGKRIIMQDVPTTQGTTAVPAQTGAAGTKSIADLQAERSKVAEQIEKKQSIIPEFKKTNIDIWDTLISENPNSTTISQWQSAKKDSEIMLSQLKAELDTLQQQLTDIDAQIASLNKK